MAMAKVFNFLPFFQSHHIKYVKRHMFRVLNISIKNNKLHILDVLCDTILLSLLKLW
jgi:hypothetical protein